MNEIRISTPGRICLFGEHQDYLGLPVIPAAISLRISIGAKRREDSQVNIQLPDIGSSESFSLREALEYRGDRDYFRSAMNVARRHGFSFATGLDCTVRGNIPINAGSSSSSALVVSWISLLAQMSDQASRLPPEEIARYAHAAEVIEFGEPGGMMDHYSTACGGVLFLRFHPGIHLETITADLKGFVLGDSGEPKDTKSILARTKHLVLDIVRRLSDLDPKFSLQELTEATVSRWEHALDERHLELLRGTVQNHSLTIQAKKLLEHVPLDHRRLGDLLSQHQSILRDILKVSTPKIDRMIESAMNAGAFGGKINGSGGGGCMFAYAPERPERVAEAIRRAGGKAYIVTVDEGTRTEAVGTG